MFLCACPCSQLVTMPAQLSHQSGLIEAIAASNLLFLYTTGKVQSVQVQLQHDVITHYITHNVQCVAVTRLLGHEVENAHFH